MSAHDETYGNAPGLSGAFPGAVPRTPYAPAPRPQPFVLCRACGRDDEWVNQFHCRTCGAPVKKRIA